MDGYERAEINRRVRDILRALHARGIDHVKTRRIQKEFDEDITHQALRPTIERLVEDDELERWQDHKPTGRATYRITLDYACHLCGDVHDSMHQALVCCAGKFGDSAGTGLTTVRGPSPGLVDHLVERDAR